MGVRQQPEKGERSLYSARYRISIEGAKGIDDSEDPATLPDENVVEAVNCRVHDGIIVARGGQEVVLSSPMTGCVYGMVEVETGSYVKMFVQVNGDDYWGNPCLYVFNPQASPSLINCSTDTVNVLPSLQVNNAGSPRFCFVRYNGSVVGTILEGSIYTVRKIIPTSEEDGTEGTGIRTEVLFKFPSGVHPSSYAVLPPPDPVASEEILFIGTVQGGVYAFSQSTGLITLAAPATFTNRVILLAYHGTIYACHTQGISRLNYAPQGNSIYGTSWTALTMPSSAYPAGVTDFRPTGVAVYKEKGYVCGWDDDVVGGGGSSVSPGCILSITDTGTGTPTVAVAHEIHSGSPPYAEGADYACDLAVFGGVLLYAWDGYGSVTHQAWTGSYNGSTWTDEAYGFFGETGGFNSRIYDATALLYGGIWLDPNNGISILSALSTPIANTAYPVVDMIAI